MRIRERWTNRVKIITSPRPRELKKIFVNCSQKVSVETFILLDVQKRFSCFICLFRELLNSLFMNVCLHHKINTNAYTHSLSNIRILT